MLKHVRSLSANPPAAWPGDATNRHILLIEDNAITQMFVAQVLGLLSYVVDAVETGQEGLAHAARQSYAAVLIDGRLPDMPGYQVLAMLRQTPPYDDGRPLVALCGDIGGVYQERFTSAGATSFLAKPFRPDDLVAALGG